MMPLFFNATHTAAAAFAAEFTFRPYYNLGFHLEAITCFFCHLLRAMYDLAVFIFRIIITPFCLLNPFSWPNIPGHALELVDNLLGFTISLMSIAIHPVLSCLRTLHSIIRGYVEGSNSDWGIEAEEEDITAAMAIW